MEEEEDTTSFHSKCVFAVLQAILRLITSKVCDDRYN